MCLQGLALSGQLQRACRSVHRRGTAATLAWPKTSSSSVGDLAGEQVRGQPDPVAEGLVDDRHCRAVGVGTVIVTSVGRTARALHLCGHQPR